MERTSTLLAIVSTLISSVALVGVMIGLLLQARQLRMNNIQTFKASHAELIRMMMDYPESWADSSDSVTPDPDSLRKHAMTNWQVRNLQFGYDAGTVPERSVRWEVAHLFAVSHRREWWALVRASYDAAMVSRRDRRFFQIVDEECGRAVTSSATADVSISPRR